MRDLALYALALIGGAVCVVIVLGFLAGCALRLFGGPFPPLGDD